MCGILTVAGKSGDQLDPSACRRALSSLSWRGPDLCVASIWRERVFLGQTVLSLTGDITDASGEHARSISGRYTVAFNGEIYNFRDLAARWLGRRMSLDEHTTDTEVLANLHDAMRPADVAAALDGMYAFAVLDHEEEALYFCRDVQGEKSLYAYEDDHRVIISSEIPAIESLVPRLSFDRQVLRDYFRTRHFMQFSRTAFENVRQIPPGAVERLDLRTMCWTTVRQQSIREWIDPARMESNAQRSLASLTDELDALLTQTTKEMLPDRRKYAAVLSGGVDSSLTGHYLVAHGSPDMLVAVDHLGKDRISSDLIGFEAALGRRIEVLRVDHIPYSGEITRCQHVCGSPLGSHSYVAQALQSARVRSADCRVIFGGEGGDEVFGGYGDYLAPATGDTLYSPSPYMALHPTELGFDEDDPSTIERELHAAWKIALDAYAFIESPTDRAAAAMMYADTAYQLAAVGLRGADLMSMMWSVEARTILIRRPVLQFALNLPMFARINPTHPDPTRRTKVLLKALFQRYYPAELLLPKQGFAGFPNESASYLGHLADYLIYETIRVTRPATGHTPYSAATLWKLANVEYFLRGRRR